MLICTFLFSDRLLWNCSTVCNTGNTVTMTPPTVSTNYYSSTWSGPTGETKTLQTDITYTVEKNWHISDFIRNHFFSLFAQVWIFSYKILKSTKPLKGLTKRFGIPLSNQSFWHLKSFWHWLWKRKCFIRMEIHIN